METFKKGQRLKLVTVKNSVYYGDFATYNQKKDQVCLTQICVCNKDGSYKAVAGGGITRWFNMSSVKSLETALTNVR